MSSLAFTAFYRKNRGLVKNAEGGPIAEGMDVTEKTWIIPTGDRPRHSLHHLSLLPSGPDEVRDRLLRGARPDESRPHVPKPREGALVSKADGGWVKARAWDSPFTSHRIRL